MQKVVVNRKRRYFALKVKRWFLTGTKKFFLALPMATQRVVADLYEFTPVIQ